MRTTPLHTIVLSLLGGLAACGGSDPAVLRGSITTGQYALDNPIVSATSLEGVVYLSHIQADGTFQVTVPVGDTYSLALANTVAAEKYATVSHIDWGTADGAVRYLTVTGGGTIDLGKVSQVDYGAPNGPQAQSAGVGDDDASSHGKSHGTCDDDGKPKPVAQCDPPTTGESHCEHDVDAHHGCAAGKAGGGSSSGTVTPSSTPSDNGEPKVTICHIPPGNAGNAHTIVVGASAVPAHLAHGDYLGACLDSAPPTTTCPPTGTPTPPVTTPPTPSSPPPASGTTPSGGTCVMNSDCASGLSCVSSTCGIVVL